MTLEKARKATKKFQSRDNMVNIMGKIATFRPKVTRIFTIEEPATRSWFLEKRDELARHP